MLSAAEALRGREATSSARPAARHAAGGATAAWACCFRVVSSTRAVLSVAGTHAAALGGARLDARQRGQGRRRATHQFALAPAATSSNGAAGSGAPTPHDVSDTNGASDASGEGGSAPGLPTELLRVGDTRFVGWQSGDSDAASVLGALREAGGDGNRLVTHSDGALRWGAQLAPEVHRVRLSLEQHVEWRGQDAAHLAMLPARPAPVHATAAGVAGQPRSGLCGECGAAHAGGEPNPQLAA